MKPTLVRTKTDAESLEEAVRKEIVRRFQASPLSQSDLADQCNWAKSDICFLLQGQRRFSFYRLMEVGETLGVVLEFKFHRNKRTSTKT